VNQGCPVLRWGPDFPLVGADRLAHANKKLSISMKITLNCPPGLTGDHAKSLSSKRAMFAQEDNSHHHSGDERRNAHIPTGMNCGLSGSSDTDYISKNNMKNHTSAIPMHFGKAIRAPHNSLSAIDSCIILFPCSKKAQSHDAVGMQFVNALDKPARIFCEPRKRV
jgi:hypothetical protein